MACIIYVHHIRYGQQAGVFAVLGVAAPPGTRMGRKSVAFKSTTPNPLGPHHTPRMVAGWHGGTWYDRYSVRC